MRMPLHKIRQISVKFTEDQPEGELILNSGKEVIKCYLSEAEEVVFSDNGIVQSKRKYTIYEI